ncbi:MAG: hypothetical protein JXR77_00665 [Lentisphaeria bacterium]|nr:hypothetical protein [Lentisphaeria bacterium]
MKRQSARKAWHGTALAAAAVLLAAVASRSQEDASPWPRRMVADPYQVALYEPQIESYDDDWMTGRAALSVIRNREEPVFGAVWFGMRLRVDRERRTAVVLGFRTDVVRFPADAPADAEMLGRILGRGTIGMELLLDPLLQSLQREAAAMEAAVAGSQAVPDILWVPYPTVVIRLDGEPVLEDLPGTDLLAVANTSAFMVMQKGSGQWFLLLGDEYLGAAAYTGPWQEAPAVPASVTRAAAQAGVPLQSLPGKPRVLIATRPTEVLVTEGDPRYTVIPGTTLLYVTNTDADLFLEIGEQKHYVLLAGRWFAARSLDRGPWEPVLPERLPATFASIPPDSPKYGVLASVPGTQVAAEVVRDAQLPSVRSVAREPVTVTVEYYGEPQYVQVGTSQVYYAVNTPYSVVRVAPYYYLCLDGAWYWGGSAIGPWSVCVSVPGVIYTIPPTCPIYPVTYVRVYDWTPSYVYVGYTAGYFGWHIGWKWGGLVFGFAYYDDDWHHRHHRYQRYYAYHGYQHRPPYYGPSYQHGYHYYDRWYGPPGRHPERYSSSIRKIEPPPKPELVSRSPSNYYRDKTRWNEREATARAPVSGRDVSRYGKVETTPGRPREADRPDYRQEGRSVTPSGSQPSWPTGKSERATGGETDANRRDLPSRSTLPDRRYDTPDVSRETGKPSRDVQPPTPARVPEPPSRSVEPPRAKPETVDRNPGGRTAPAPAPDRGVERGDSRGDKGAAQPVSPPVRDVERSVPPRGDQGTPAPRTSPDRGSQGKEMRPESGANVPSPFDRGLVQTPSRNTLPPAAGETNRSVQVYRGTEPSRDTGTKVLPAPMIRNAPAAVIPDRSAVAGSQRSVEVVPSPRVPVSPTPAVRSAPVPTVRTVPAPTAPAPSRGSTVGAVPVPEGTLPGAPGGGYVTPGAGSTGSVKSGSPSPSGSRSSRKGK